VAFFIFLIHYLQTWHVTQALTGSKLTKRTIIANGLNLRGPKL